jgi:hypothetical protein
MDYDVRHLAERIEKADQIEKRLDGIDAKLDLLIRRAQSKTKVE